MEKGTSALDSKPQMRIKKNKYAWTTTDRREEISKNKSQRIKQKNVNVHTEITNACKTLNAKQF